MCKIRAERMREYNEERVLWYFGPNVARDVSGPNHGQKISSGNVSLAGERTHQIILIRDANHSHLTRLHGLCQSL